MSIAEDVPFDIPDSWEWVRLSSIVTTLGGYAFKSTEYTTSGIRVIRISDFSDDSLLYSDYKYYKEVPGLEKYLIKENDILMCMTGGTVGKTCLLGECQEKLYLNQRVACIRNISHYVVTGYLYIVLIAPHIKEIVASSKTSTNDNISMETISDFLLPLPPLNEQNRIIAQYQGLLPLIEKYRLVYNENEYLNESFPEQLKKSILQLAVQGKLVPQDPSDEPASVLLEKIHAEKERLIKEGKIKRDKNESVIYRRDNSHYEKQGNTECCIDDEIPFEIPDSWEWSRLNNCLDVRDGTHDTPKYVPSGVPLVTSKNLPGGYIDFSSCKQISYKDAELINQRSKVDDDDILFAMIGSIGNPVLYKGYDYFCIKNMALFKSIRNGLDMKYVYWWLFLSQDNMKKQASGAVQSFVSLNYLRNYLIPVPPLNEQIRIVIQISRALSLCDSL